MATGSNNGALPVSNRKRLRKSPFFTILGLILLLVAVAGFWPQYFSVVAGRTPARTTQYWLIHLHAALFMAWLLLYVSQASLILSGRARLHFRFGPWVAGYGFAIAAIGLFASGLLAHRLGIRENDAEAAAAFVLFPILDMLFFAGFLAAAIIFRKVPHIHKRAMFLATFSMAIVGLGRLVGRMPFDSPWVWQPLNLAPVLIALTYDVYVCRRMYGIMAIGLLVHLARLNAEPFANSEMWLPIGRTFISPFG